MNLFNGHQQVTPYIMVSNGQVFTTFLQETFDAQLGQVIKSTNGRKITHGEIKIGESVIFFADGTEEDVSCDNDDCETDEQDNKKEPSNIHIHVYVNNAKEVVEKAEKAGGTSVIPMIDDESGQMGGFLDPFNNLWWVKSLNK